MADRTPATAIHRLLDVFQRDLSCVTRGNSLYTDSYQPEHDLSVYLPAEQSIRMRGEHRLSLDILLIFRAVADSDAGGWRTTIRKYMYTINDHDDRELFAFHWHPDTPGMPTPHVHLGAALGELRPTFSRLHIPTARIALEDVLRFLIRDLAVQPLRDDWSALLNAGRTWA